MALTGLLGGTFNPIHNGHLRAAEEVMKYFPLDRILFIPSYIPPHKDQKEVVPACHRWRMVEIACQGKPGFIPSDLEIKSPGPSYSILTLRKLKEIFPEDIFWFIVGSDAFLEIETWKDYNQLLKECSFIVVRRPGCELEKLDKVIDRIKPELLVRINKREKTEVKDYNRPGLYLLEIDALNISSSEIRRRLRAGLPIKGLVPPGVEDYIMKNRLYV
ncbi:MAG TPA: nicotinate-nucleotide adenylyltransferase [Candidatus Saccharicenans sp.]|jgi:nicotinate-nucleotide adenylyltransferase|nr:nicotinate-nucleotide adenylyltransferase [Candidatus Saccharicenans sp.]HQO75368.1 nicotinate-nucleotide adenylyltransferase [Candidatus Saccharicenans sp.]HUM78615.1 nicotinate-nucleotide adenylyltransferase [Candidatus Saccharicenans sp.]